jgi:3-phosphoshikimate 1-carboxyvinyltransferase
MPNPTVLLPGCKSTTQRALICAALGGTDVVLSGLSVADDCVLLREGLQVLGVQMRIIESSGDWLVQGCSGEVPVKEATIDCNAGGTTFRFLLAICATQGGVYHLRTDRQLRGRPHQALFDALKRLNCQVESTETGWRVDSREWRPRDLEVDCQKSSQYLSALTLSQFASNKFAVCSVPDSRSMPYFDLTLRVIDDFEKLPTTYSVPGDFSAAMYFAGRALVTRSPVSFSNELCLRHPEEYAFDFLKTYCGLDAVDHSFVVAEVISSASSNIIYDVAQAPDASLLVAVVCRILKLPVEFVNSEILRHKESDRQQALRALQTAQDEIDSCDDHRIAMAAAVLQLEVSHLRINNRDCVSKSFPDFFQQWAKFD